MPLRRTLDRVTPVLNPPNSSAHQPHFRREAARFGPGEWFVVISALLSVIGWILALTGVLHRTGYAVALIVALAAAVLLGKGVGLHLPRLPWRRWKRALPFAFAAMLILSFLGGI